MLQTKSQSVPDCSVLMPVHNGMPFLEEAVRSIMAQTLYNIEILIIDDASTDGSPEILRRLADEDARIRIETLPTNLRLPMALNHGLRLAKSPLIARMDADDIAVANRLELQKAYMDKHTNVVLCGGGVRRFRPDGSTLSISAKSKDDFAIRWLMKFRLSILHPTWMMRNPVLCGADIQYDPAFLHVEDHDFLARMLDLGQVVGIPSLLLHYRVHENSITSTNWADQNRRDEEIFERCVSKSYPYEVTQKLGPLRDAYFRSARIAPREIINGFIALLEFDKERYPEKIAWMKRQTMQLIFETLRRGGLSSRQAVLAIVVGSPTLIPSFLLRAAETKNLLPRLLDTEPSV